MTTLYRRTYKTPNFIGSGSATILSRATEEMLVYIIKKFADWGYGLTFRHLQKITNDYLKYTDQLHLFKNGMPTAKWFRLFKLRWKNELSERSAENISKARAASCTASHIASFFEVLQKAYSEANLASLSNIWKVDETGISGDQGQKKFYAQEVLSVRYVSLVTTKKFIIQYKIAVMRAGFIFHRLLFINQKIDYTIHGAKVDH